jgi:uncharacterized membrane protein
MEIDWGYWLMEIGSWVIAFALTFGLFGGLLWCIAKLCELNDRR